jgi:hypothetical protein
MASRAGTLYVDLLLNSKRFIDELDKSRTASTTFGVAVGSIMAGIAKSIGRLASDAATALPRLVSSQIQFADAIQAASEKTGASVETLSVLKHQAELSDVSFESLTTGLGRFGRTVADAVAAPSGQAAVAMRRLGIDLEGVKKGTVGIDEAFLQAADGISKIGNSFEIARVGQAAFGKGAQEILPILKQGREGFEAARKELELFGGLLTAETAQQADQFKDNITRLETAVNSLGLQIAGKVLPSLVALTEQFISTAKEGEGVESIGKSIGEAFRTTTQFALTSALAVTGFVGGLSQLAEEIQRIRLASAEAAATVLPEFLAPDLEGLRSGLKDREQRTQAIAGTVQKILDMMNAVDEAANRAGKSLGKTELPSAELEVEVDPKELERLIETFEKSLKPADDLEKEIRQLEAAGKSASDVIKVYGQRIAESVAAQRALGQPVSIKLEGLAEQIELHRQLVNSLRGQLEAQFALRSAPNILESLRKQAEQLPAFINEGTASVEALGSALDALNSIDPPEASIKGIQELDAAFDRLGLQSGFELSGIAAQMEKDFETILKSGQASAEQIAEAFVETQEAIKAAAESGFGTWTEEQEKALERGRQDLAKFKKDASDTGREIGQAISSGLEDAMRHWEGFGKLAIGILEDITATILRNSVTAPLTGLLSSVFGGLLGGIGGAAAAANPVVRAAEGGKLAANMTALVGEAKKAELFVPENFLQSVRKAGDGARLQAFPDLSAALELIPKAPAAALEIGEFSKSLVQAFPKKKGPSFAGKMPFLVGKEGPEIFTPPVPGTIVPLDTPQGAKLYQRMKSLGLTRESGGHVSTGGRFLGGERGLEAFIPDSASGGTGGGNTTNVYLTINGDPSPETIRQQKQLMGEVYQRAVGDSVRIIQEQRLRGA